MSEPYRNELTGAGQGGEAETPTDTPSSSSSSSSALLIAQLERRGLPPEVLQGLKSLPPDQLAAVLPALLQAVELEVKPLSAADAALIARDPRRFGFLEADVRVELEQAREWNTGSGPVALGAFDAQQDEHQLAGFVIARVEATASAAARALAAAAPDPGQATPLLQRALKDGRGGSSTSGPVACVALLGVDYAFRGQGVGSALLGAVEDVIGAVAAEMGARAAAGGGGKKGGGGGTGAVALVAPDGDEGNTSLSPSGPARFYAGRGYRRAHDGQQEQAEALSRALLVAGEEGGGGGGDDGERRRRRRFGLWVKRVGGAEEEGGEQAAASSLKQQQRRRQQQSKGGGGKGGFGSVAPRRAAAAAAATALARPLTTTKMTPSTMARPLLPPSGLPARIPLVPPVAGARACLRRAGI